MIEDIRLRVYLSNAMTDQPEHGIPWFNEVAKDLRRQGIWVLSPPEIMHGGDQHFNEAFTHQDYVDADIAQMLEKCNAIAVGPAWQLTEGPRREVCVAILSGWPVYRVVDRWSGYKLELF